MGPGSGTRLHPVDPVTRREHLVATAIVAVLALAILAGYGTDWWVR